MREFNSLSDEIIYQLDYEWRTGAFANEYENHDFIVYSRPPDMNAFIYMLGIPFYFLYSKAGGGMVQGVDDLSMAKKLADGYSEQKSDIDKEVAKSKNIYKLAGKDGPTIN